jgi:hypothetical protein
MHPLQKATVYFLDNANVRQSYEQLVSLTLTGEVSDSSVSIRAGKTVMYIEITSRERQLREVLYPYTHTRL